MRLDDFLEPRAGDEPSGENLVYDPVFTALLLAAQPGEERQAGSEIIAAADPDWMDVATKALAVLERSHDLRAAVILAPAQVRLHGWSGLAGVTHYIRGCLEQWWDTCHPQLDPDDDNDPTMRISTVLGLASAEPMLRVVKLCPLSESTTLGRMNLRDLAIADGEISAPAGMQNSPDAATVAAAFRDTRPDVLVERLAMVRQALADVEGINGVFDARSPGDGPTLEPLTRLLKKAVARLAAELGEPDVEVSDVAAPPEGEQPVQIVVGARNGSIASPKDVADALDRIMDYYKRCEPSSPLPILLIRARRLVGADFLTIIKDLAPSGLESVRNFGGLEPED